MSRIRKTILGVVASLVIASVAQAQQADVSSRSSASNSFPRLVRFSGTLPERRGASPAAAARVTFAIYEEQSGGAALWSEVQDIRHDAQGRYSVLLGAASSDGLPAELFSTAGARWLGVQVEGRSEEARILLVAVPYALKAADADTLGGKPATAFVASDQLKDQVRDEVKTQATQSGSTTRTLIGTAPTPQVIAETSPATFTCATSGVCVETTQSGAGGIALRGAVGSATGIAGIFDNLGGGKILSGRTTSYAEKFYVDGSGNLWAGGAIVANSYPGTSGAAVFGVATAGSGTAYGVRGQSASPSGTGVFGYATSATGLTYGLLGSNLSASGTGLSGSASSLTGNTIGVRAVVQSPNGTAAIFDNLGGGKLISARTTGYAEKFSVSSTGNVAASNLTVASSTSPVIVANNTSGGQIFSGRNNGVETISIGGTGNIAGVKATFTSSAGGVPLTLVQTENQYALVAQSQGVLNCAAGVFESGTPTGSVGCGGIYAESTNGHVGVYGRSTGSYGVLGITDTSTSGVFGASPATSGGGVGVSGVSASTGGKGLSGLAWSTTGTTYGVYAESDSSLGTGVMAYAPSTTGTTFGVYADIAGDAGTAVFARNTSATGTTYGVHTQVASTSGTAIWGEATGATGTTAGVIGYAASSGGNAILGLNGDGPYGSATKAGVYGESTLANGNGVIGVANNGGAAYGVWGKSSTGLAGVFAGNVSIVGDLSISGNLSKGTGTFKIDHPLDPQNKYLSHSFVESPEMKDMYDGVARLDSTGRAWVTLPEWFEALNGRFRYQLTAVGASQPGLYIAHEVAGNRFEIAGGRPGGKVSWMVTGVRQDAFARKHPTRVEEDKGADERGYYLHPEAFGQPETKGIAWAQEQKHLLAMREGARETKPSAKGRGK